MHGDFFPIGSHGPAYFPPISVTKKSAFEKMDFFKKIVTFKQNVTLK